MSMFETQRLQYSIITADDFDAVFETLNDEATCKAVSFLSWPLTDEQVTHWCDKATIGARNKTEYLLIARDENNNAIGCIGIHLDPKKPNCAEIGYWVSASAQGQGFATEMLKGGVEFSRTLDLQELYATTALGNDGSQNVLTKNKFTESGLLDVPMPDGTDRPSRLFTKTLKP